MTMSTALAWSVGRALVAATAALPIALMLPVALSSIGSDRQRRSKGFSLLVTVGLLLPLIVPDLLVGFTYRLTSARLVHSSAATELLYLFLLTLKSLALQVAARLILPDSTVSRESLHSLRLLRPRFARGEYMVNLVRLLATGPWRTPLIGWMISVLFSFQEFETAALVQVNRHPIAWTVWLFDAHAAGETLPR
ncbi:MAG: hypothetical protein KDA89_23980, partial [Planctomycetaceae bacterium]|nr:hypothetical protein [Planctomycetaceae bacterium]